MKLKWLPAMFLMVCPVMFLQPTPISQYDIEIKLAELQNTFREQYGKVEGIKPKDLGKQHLRKECILNFSGCEIRKCYQGMDQIFSCESTGRQFDKEGNPLRSYGNIGIGQINETAHHDEYTKLGLDIYTNPLDNISYSVLLYKREGIKPGEQWSGHCFLPNLDYTICDKK